MEYFEKCFASICHYYPPKLMPCVHDYFVRKTYVIIMDIFGPAKSIK